jgi:thiopurine S-methyltransferase
MTTDRRRGTLAALTMDKTFWNDRWAQSQIGFHEGRPNRYLERYVDQLRGRRRVLVPLCGKSEDLAYLAGHGHEVVGVELVADAARAFFAEHAATPTVTDHGALTAYAAEGITILVGDVFATSRAVVGAIDAFYDRAALVALPPTMRAAYVAHLRALVAPAALGLVITFEYAQERMDGPPFAVLEPELRALYAGAHVDLLDQGPATGGRSAEIGALERCFLVAL